MLFHKLQGAGGTIGGGGKSLVFVNSEIGSITSSDSVTFSDVSIGDADSSRIVAIYITSVHTASTEITSVTIGGVSATQAVSTGRQIRVNEIWYAEVVSGTIANVVVNYDRTMSGSADAHVFSLYNMTSATPVTAKDDSKMSSTGVNSSLSATFTPSDDSFMIAGYSSGGIASGTTASWTNANEVFDFVDGSNLDTGATGENLPASSLTVSCVTTDSSVNRPGLVLATWA